MFAFYLDYGNLVGNNLGMNELVKLLKLMNFISFLNSISGWNKTLCENFLTLCMHPFDRVADATDNPTLR